MTQNIQQLVDRAKNHENEAFAKLFDLYFNRLYQFVLKRVSDTAVAEDITSDVFLEVVDQIQSFQEKSQFSTWLYGIAKNKVARYWREKYNMPTSPLQEYLLYEDQPEYSSPKALVEKDEFDAADERWEHSRKILNEAMSHLGDSPRRLIELRFLQNYTLEEAADALDMKKNTAKVMQFRALKKLRELAQDDVINFVPFKSES